MAVQAIGQGRSSGCVKELQYICTHTGSCMLNQLSYILKLNISQGNTRRPWRSYTHRSSTLLCRV
jgi:hypothetical protein